MMRETGPGEWRNGWKGVMSLLLISGETSKAVSRRKEGRMLIRNGRSIGNTH